MTKTVLITQPCFNYCSTMFAQRQGPLCFSLCLPWRDQGVCTRLRGDTARQMECSMPYNVMLSNTIGKKGDLRSLVVFCWGTGQASVYRGKQWVTAFTSLDFFCFLFPIQLFLCLLNNYLDTQVFLLLFFSSSPVTLGVCVWGGSQQVAVWCSAVQQG